MRDDIIQAVQRGQFRLQDLKPGDLPEVSAAELKVINFEVRAGVAHGAVNGISEKLRECITERHALVAAINNVTREHDLIRNARAASIDHSRGDGRLRFQQQEIRKYLGREAERLILALAVNQAQQHAYETERNRLKAEWEPLQRIARGMREELQKVQDAERQARAATAPPRDQTPDEVIAEARYNAAGGPTDDLPAPHALQMQREAQEAAGQIGRPLTTGKPFQPAQGSATPAGPAWLQTLQDKAYGGRDVE